MGENTRVNKSVSDGWKSPERRRRGWYVDGVVRDEEPGSENLISSGSLSS